MKFVALAALVLILTAGAEAGPDDARIYAGHLPGAEPENVGVVQVLDARTGRPLEGVSVRLHLESAATGFTGAELLGRTATDAFGLASIRWPHTPSDGHWVFEKKGCAVVTLFGCFPPDRVWLRKGGETSVRILDPFGRPAAGVTAELLQGCGHSPTVRIARTNAEGILTLRDVEPGTGRVWIRMPGVKTEAFYVPRDGGTIALDPGTTIEGTVVDVEEKPVEGVVVASLQSPRGPTAVTDEKGRFRLDGVEPEGEVWFFHESWYRSERPFLVLTDVDLPAMGGPRPPLRLVLPPETVEDEDEYREFLAPSPIEVPVSLSDAKTGEELPDVPVVVISRDTGLGVLEEGEEDEDGEPTGRRIVRVEPGTYRISTGSAFSRYRIVSPDEDVILSVGLKCSLVATAEERPRLEVTGVTEEMYDVRVALPYASADIEDVEGVPLDEPAVIVVRSEGGVRFFPLGP
ncbi:MAG: carboxypeptidase-like regulatory domain-containing protein, partial [Planctomycetota bacterium]